VNHALLIAALVAYVANALGTYAVLVYLDARRDTDDGTAGNLAAAVLWPIPLACVVLFAALAAFLAPFRAIERRARAAGERDRKDGAS
jgi:hypothetical protein